nr:radical SAM protein [Pseudobacteriovorax antillogorgiicola]
MTQFLLSDWDPMTKNPSPILLMTPPMTQLNTPYPATAYLTGFLGMHSYHVEQRDPAIDLIHKLMSRPGLEEVFEEVCANYEDIPADDRPLAINFFIDHVDLYLKVADPALRFLQGQDPSLAMRIASRRFLPEGVGFSALHQMEELEGEHYLERSFGQVGTQDKAKYLASLFLDDLAQIIKLGIDPRFELSRYGERLAASNPSFDDLHDSIHGQETLVDDYLEDCVLGYLDEVQPTVVGLTVPFPGNVYGALRIAKTVKAWRQDCKVIMGGGFVNTELRSLKDPRVFEFIDYITVDDGERPLLCLLEHLAGERDESQLFRTYVLKDGQVSFIKSSKEHDIPHKDTGTPSYRGLPLHRYLSICEMPNPMQRIWSDGRWNKLTLAHGCYWSKCSFCDISLDYIERYDEAKADLIIDRMEQLMAETGQSGFHFVDEAAPPKVLFAMARRIIERGLSLTWWGNIRFERTFSPKMAELMAESGCVAVSGGLEVASDRLLKLMNKGVTVEQVARVTRALSDAGILVHAYLMYGFPSQTEQETIDALERVRQLFQEGCIQSAFWHRFAATIHSPVGQKPQDFGIELLPLPEINFASNDVDFIDPIACNHDQLGIGLKRALYNYMNGIGMEEPLHIWFDNQVPEPLVSPNLIAEALRSKL